jgi:hypothetical protein
MVRHRVFAGGDDGATPIGRLLFAFVGAPVIWALHLAASYFVVTLDCISAWNGAGWALAAITVIMAAGSATAGWTAWRMRRDLGPDPAAGRAADGITDGASDERHWLRFLLTAGLAGSVLFTVVIIAEGVAPAFVSLCA